MNPPSRPVALVTGGFRGIGLGCALGLARAGFDIALNDLPNEANEALVPELARQFAALGSAFLPLLRDIASLEHHPQLLAAIDARFGRLDCLVNNAGVPARQRGDLLEVSPESFDRCLQVNARAVFFLLQATAKGMLEAPPGTCHRSLITITSSNAIAVSISRGEYCASKSAASMISRLFAVRLANHGIGVYEVRPGLIETDMTRPAKARYDAMIADHALPIERWGKVEDVASTVVAMAEGRLPYTVGQAIAVDGGLTHLHY